MSKINVSDLVDFKSINDDFGKLGLHLPDAVRIRALRQCGFKDTPTLGNLYRFAAQSRHFPLSVTESWGRWKGVALESDNHFRNPFEVEADTPENAAADVIVWMVKNGHIKP